MVSKNLILSILFEKKTIMSYISCDFSLGSCVNLFRLVMYIERDSSKKLPLILENSEEDYPNDQAILQPPNSEYMQSALYLLVRHILFQCPPIISETLNDFKFAFDLLLLFFYKILPSHFSGTCVTLLDETSGRKHPSTIHVKQLKACLPTCAVLTSTVTSHVIIILYYILMKENLLYAMPVNKCWISCPHVISKFTN